ncbi:hypothetical protein C5167_029269 [Papaver somniferum]|nr:hypothetical protein C5167_029269 [Papaver somniferum]
MSYDLSSIAGTPIVITCRLNYQELLQVDDFLSCLQRMEEESVNHLFRIFRFQGNFSPLILQIRDGHRAFAHSMIDMVWFWASFGLSAKGKIVWNFIPSAAIWVLWNQ